MTDATKDVHKIIKKTSEQTAQAVVIELKRQGLMRDNKQTPFQKTEQLLYNYNNFKTAIDDKNDQIQELKQHGLKQKSKSITSFSTNGSGPALSDNEKIEDKIKSIEKSIMTTRRLVKIIDDALAKIDRDPYVDIIRMKYFDQISREEISERFAVDVSTVTRNKNRLINTLKVFLFSDEVIMELYS